MRSLVLSLHFWDACIPKALDICVSKMITVEELQIFECGPLIATMILDEIVEFLDLNDMGAHVFMLLRQLENSDLRFAFQTDKHRRKYPLGLVTNDCII